MFEDQLSTSEEQDQPHLRATAYATLPPPTVGIAVATKRFLEATAPAIQWVVKDVGRNSNARGKGQLSRLQRNLAGLVTCMFVRRSTLGIVYMPVSAGITMIYNIAFALVCKLRRVPVMFHHHSYSYINRRSTSMAVLNYLLGPRDCQVFLSSTMRDQFDKVYRRKSQAAVLPNAYAVDLHPPPRLTAVGASDVLKIGHLSNLTMEKGLGTVVEAFCFLKSKGVNCELHLAGPTTDSVARQVVEQAIARFPDSIKWHGPVYGENKDAFFKSIDWFWFPTEYKHEAQPIVLVEALAYGVPAAAIQRGCIEWLLGDAGLTLPDKDQFLNSVCSDGVVQSIVQGREASQAACLARLEEIQRIEREGFEQVVSFVEHSRRQVA